MLCFFGVSGDKNWSIVSHSRSFVYYVVVFDSCMSLSIIAPAIYSHLDYATPRYAIDAQCISYYDNTNHQVGDPDEVFTQILKLVKARFADL